MRPTTLSPQSGIALGPILFLLAIIGIIGLVLSAGSGGFSVAGVADRVTADTVSQANLIRSVISQCNMQYQSNQSSLSVPPTYTLNPDAFPETYTNSSGTVTSSAGSVVLVSNLQCNASGSTTAIPSPPSLPSSVIGLWSTGINLPPPTTGFQAWSYIDASSTNGGRCIYTQPTASSGGIVQGLTNALRKFTNSTSNDGKSEVNYNPALPNQRFVVWISAPPAAGSENANCKPQ